MGQKSKESPPQELTVNSEDEEAIGDISGASEAIKTRSKTDKPMVNYTEQESAIDIHSQMNIVLGMEEEEEYIPTNRVEVEEDEDIDV